jgi:riboflavin biosynthesis pyrimidine reductase
MRAARRWSASTACSRHPRATASTRQASSQRWPRDGLRLLFVEGGGVTVSRFLATGSLDRLHLIFAPLLIGAGRTGLHRRARVASARAPARVLPLGDDVLWDLDLRAAQPPLQPRR